MSKLTTKIVSAATLALAAIPMLALTTAAHAAPMSLKVGDLSTAAGVAAFEQRLDRVANKMCAAQRQDVGPRIVNTDGCVEAVRAEAMDSLTQSQRSQVAAYGRSELAAR
ncbi:MAG: UrcA family protein [Phenylobacterium sp.]|uniref:UrcA family protein n=1 Tax=Phenylobacterium sp. TaxID=1871053 RepID=UPI001B74A4D5|nr:UrcA family protein [Phenylobacterium sp.]MBP7650605.1 UrcA family protein [Phenylobacterium sp.]MBP7815762.1 UrcA family protein [Phenylobacterium sp.]MBP9231567.1 UrcA family protein [Phenylobacterium sp.]